MNSYIDIGGLRVHATLHKLAVEEALPGSEVDAKTFWRGLIDLVEKFSGRNAELIAERARIQAEIDSWHMNHSFDASAYRSFLEAIRYLVPQGPEFEIATTGVDPEISKIAGPQLVVPVINERYALNAANARWGSLYDALYGTDALGSPPPPGSYDPGRGNEVVAWVRRFLDEVVPLERGSHADSTRYSIADGTLVADLPSGPVRLADRSGLAGYLGDAEAPTSVVLTHNGLHIELVIDTARPVGKEDMAGVADVMIESAVTAIMDCEDSVAAVDTADKVAVYRNWLGLMKGDLSSEVPRAGTVITRRLAPDRMITAPDGSSTQLPGRALMMVRNVGHLMTTDAVLDSEGREVPEGLLDALFTVLAAKHDLLRTDGARNSRFGSIYVVKPKMHGPEEVAFANEVFGFVEEILDLPPYTVKMGLMDEERRTTLNLAECIRSAARRIAFINTGFLDRTGDEIHTSMRAGAMVRKMDMKNQRWLLAYENNNVDVGLACGLVGRAQIGKGMWAAPDLMADMLRDKIAHPESGANCAWVPSPTAATLHATHYHRVNVSERQAALTGRRRASLDDLLSIPLSLDREWSEEETVREVENNAQGILGYVARWVDQGVGCSKVPDIHDVALMEDRATCRVSSQHLTNWLLHGVFDQEEFLATMRRIAVVVDRQNANDPAYIPMATNFDGPSFRAACELVLMGLEQPSGYTEPILHARRLEFKSQIAAE